MLISFSLILLMAYVVARTTQEVFMKMLDMLMAYENNELDMNQTVELFQNLIDSGLIFSLQGHYIRVAKDLVEAGLIDLTTADVEE